MRWQPVWDWRDKAVREVARLMGPRVIGLAAFHLNFVVATFFASTRRQRRDLGGQLRVADRDDAARPVRDGDLDGRLPADGRAGDARRRPAAGHRLAVAAADPLSHHPGQRRPGHPRPADHGVPAPERSRSTPRRRIWSSRRWSSTRSRSSPTRASRSSAAATTRSATRARRSRSPSSSMVINLVLSLVLVWPFGIKGLAAALSIATIVEFTLLIRNLRAPAGRARRGAPDGLAHADDRRERADGGGVLLWLALLQSCRHPRSGQQAAGAFAVDRRADAGRGGVLLRQPRCCAARRRKCWCSACPFPSASARIWAEAEA